MDGHIKGVPPWRYPKKGLLILNRAQAFFGLLAPLNFTTPFYENRYQKIADLAERCWFFCEISPPFCVLRGKNTTFSVLHKHFTAFAYRICAPPSEV